MVSPRLRGFSPGPLVAPTAHDVHEGSLARLHCPRESEHGCV